MVQHDIKTTVLRNLYEANFLGDGKTNLKELRGKEGLDEKSFWKVVDRMAADGLIREWTAGGNYIITSFGIIHAEENGIASEKLAKENQRARIVAMDNMAKIYDESSDPGDAHIQSLSERTGLNINLLLGNNLQVLKDLGYVESVAVGLFQLTSKGIDAVAKLRQRSSIADEFEQLAEMSPQARGRALQRLFARVVEQHGWYQEEGMRTSNEEMDVIVYREREYYLVECKWEKEPSQADVIRELYGKLGNRADVRGIVVSMSGFTEGAVKQVVDYASSRVILLFGPDNVRATIYGQETFDGLLNEKYKELVTRRRAVFN